MTDLEWGLIVVWQIYDNGRVTLSSDICDGMRLSFSGFFEPCMIRVEMYCSYTRVSNRRRDNSHFPVLHNSQQKAENSPLLAPQSQQHGMAWSMWCGFGRRGIGVLLMQLSTPKDIADCTADSISALHLANQHFLYC